MNRLIGIAHTEQLIRKSRFVGVCGPVENPEDAARFIAEHGEPGCRHVCYAWRCGDQVRFDDAGEPGGTAGRPMLAALEHFELDRSVVVVSRWFGGIKLGTGGLARAYGGTAMEVLQAAPREPIVPMADWVVEVGFETADALFRQAEELGGSTVEENWTPNGLRLHVRLPAEASDALVRAVREITRGQGRCTQPG